MNHGDRRIPFRERARRRLGALYGEARAQAALARVIEVVDRWRGPIADASARNSRSPRPPRRAFSESDVVLIAYPDHLTRAGERPLETLGHWCRTRLRDVVSAVHVLPFHPSSSYEGYAITDYSAVDPRLGSWADLDEIGGDFEFMVDLVLNHCSSRHPWFDQFVRGEEPGRRYFIQVPDPRAPWLDSVARARNSPLLHAVATAEGERYVWTTYSPDLVDLDWREPDVCVEFLGLLLESVARGARWVRLDAFVYLWKAEGTSCVNRPELHELLRLMQDVLDEAGAGETAVLPSITNVTQAENAAYFGRDEREADLVYHLPLSGLLLHALLTGDAGQLRRWLERMEPAPPGRAYLNLAASHDGVGLTWLRDRIPEADERRLIAGALARGGRVSSRRVTAGGEERPWEINITWFSACAPESGEPAARQVDRLLATQAVVLALRGVPALYLPLFLAGRNDEERVRRSGDPRAINRGRFDVSVWEEAARDPSSPEAAALAGMTRLVRARRTCPAFHPEGDQRILDLGVAPLLAIVRAPRGCPVGGPGTVLCLTNLSGAEIELPWRRACEATGWSADRPVHDRLSGSVAAPPRALAPWQAAWLEAS